MTKEFEIILQLTSKEIVSQQVERYLKDFSRMLGWEPSDIITVSPSLESVTNGHILVDHGLLQSAVITFLTEPYTKLEEEIRRELLSVSYNNLIDWHINVQYDKAIFVYNRSDDPKLITKSISSKDVSSLRSTMFAQITDLSINPNFPALDEALINNISYWKRNIAAELNNKPALEDYSTLFNSIIFLRAIEDHKKRFLSSNTHQLLTLRQELNSIGKDASLYSIINKSLSSFVNGSVKEFLHVKKIKKFDSLNFDLVYELLTSFYKSRYIPYDYDFAIISKHALSRIYEHYVSFLNFEEQNQLALFSVIPQEEIKKTYGSVYTPQFIARYFSRFLIERTPPSILREMKIIDPACGSGIFLRTILEYLCNPNYEVYSSKEIEGLFNNIFGIDIDYNAVESARLSLSLLYLVLMNGKLPKYLNINKENSLEYFLKKGRDNNYDVVLSNPPYISFDNLNQESKTSLTQYLGEQFEKKPDFYLGFLKLAIETLKPGGFGFFVLPHSFLRTTSAKKMRSLLAEKTWIISLADLSAIPVFEDKGSYVILLIFQKKLSNINQYPNATIALCRDFAGHALEDLVKNRKVETDFYKIFDVSQSYFKEEDWENVVVSPFELSIKKKLLNYKKLSDIFEIKQGIITGGDDVFIIRRKDIPNGETSIWRPLIKDRDIPRYEIPKTTNYYVFYPLEKDKKLTLVELRKKYPQSWDYLKDNKKKLPPRKFQDKIWWMPVSLRSEKTLFIPKIITPHLVLIPRFSFDKEGKFAISHSPYLYPKVFTGDFTLFYYIIGILNSSIGAWLLSTHSDKYSKGYARLEVKTLRNVSIPDPARVEKELLSKLINLVNQKVKSPQISEIDKEIDIVVSRIYGLNSNEEKIMGFEGYHARN